MPKRKRNIAAARRKRRRKSAPKAYRRRRTRMYRSPRIMKMFPKSSKVELTYCEELTVPNRQTSAHPFIFRLNSCYDPNYTAIGHQPRGFDQWMNIYNNYTVIGARVKIEPLFRASGSNAPTTLHGWIDDDFDTDNRSITEIVELGMRGTRYNYCDCTDPAATQTAVGIKRYKNPNLYFKVGMKKFFGLSKKTQMVKISSLGMGDVAAPEMISDYSGTDTTNPARHCLLKLRADGVDTQTATVNVRVTIKQIVIFHNPKEITAS